MSFSELSMDVLYNSNGNVMVGCGCKNLHDVVLFIREKKIEYVELAWADEMGLWHHETVPVSELTFATLQEGVPCKDGKFLVPDPLSARIAPRSQPNIMHFTCMPPTSRASLKTKHLNPEWIEMISKKLMENDKRPSIPLDKNYVGELFADASSSPPSRHMYYAKRNSLSVPVPSSPYGSPNSPGCVSSPGSSPGSPLRSPIGSPGNDNPPSTPSLPSLSLHYHHVPHTPHAPLTPHTPSPPTSNGSFIEWKLVRNDPYGTPPTLILPPSPPSDASFTPPGSVPSSPCLPGSPHSPVPDNQEDGLSEPKSKRSKNSQTPHVPPLLRPRQVHPTKAHKLGITKPVKKRRNTEHLYCRHCGTTETPEWRRGPDGRKSLCNACGLYFSKMIKRETMVVPQGRRVAIDALLNPHS